MTSKARGIYAGEILIKWYAKRAARKWQAPRTTTNVESVNDRIAVLTRGNHTRQRLTWTITSESIKRKYVDQEAITTRAHTPVLYISTCPCQLSIPSQNIKRQSQIQPRRWLRTRNRMANTHSEQRQRWASGSVRGSVGCAFVAYGFQLSSAPPGNRPNTREAKHGGSRRT